MKYFLIILCFFLQNCKIANVIKTSNNQKITLKKDRVEFDLIHNRVLLREDIDFVLDIGAPSVIFSNKKEQFKFSDSLSIGKLINAHGKELENKLLICSAIDNKLFKAENFVFREINKEIGCLDSCNGLLGSDIFVDETIHLNFQESYIEQIENVDISSDYLELPVHRFDGYFFYIKLEINNKKVVCKIDTGNPFGLLLRNNDFNNLNLTKQKVYFNNSKEELNYFYLSKKIISNSFQNESINIMSNLDIKRNLIGLNYLKNFNWVFDYKNGKIFYKKNKLFNEIINAKTVNIINNELIVRTVDSKNLNLLGKPIIKFRGIEVTKENICEMKELLDKTNDWDRLSIKTHKSNFVKDK